MPRGKTTGRQLHLRIPHVPLHPGYVVLVLLLALFAFKFIQRTEEVRQLTRQEMALQLQNEKTRQENARLQRAIQEYRMPRYVEGEARAVLGYTMPGEVAIMTSHIRHSRPRPQVRVAHVIAAPEPSWKQWWKAFFH
jgi:cell division protein FtsB